MYKAIKQVFLIAFLLSYRNISLSASYTEIDLPDEFAHDAFNFYNSLPEVEAADLRLKESNSFEHFLVEAQELARRHYFEESMGVRLIHRHIALKNDEIMVEKHEIIEGQDALVTRPQNKLHANKAVPASWIFDGKQYRVFEYSHDPYVFRAFEKVRNASEFLDQFARLLKKYSYQDLVALAISDREWYQKHAGKHSFLEYSYDEPTFASVVVNADELEDTYSIDAINTAWSFKRDPITLVCGTYVRCIKTKFGHANIKQHRDVV